MGFHSAPFFRSNGDSFYHADMPQAIGLAWQGVDLVETFAVVHVVCIIFMEVNRG